MEAGGWRGAAVGEATGRMGADHVRRRRRRVQDTPVAKHCDRGDRRWREYVSCRERRRSIATVTPPRGRPRRRCHTTRGGHSRPRASPPPGTVSTHSRPRRMPAPTAAAELAEFTGSPTCPSSANLAAWTTEEEHTAGGVALQAENDLLGGLRLLVEDGLGLTAETTLLAVVTTLAYEMRGRWRVGEQKIPGGGWESGRG